VARFRSAALGPIQRIRVVMIGSGELEEELRALGASERIAVHFAGFKNQSELPACYAAGDVLVLCSGSETWGLVVNEAMACGLPVIVSDVVGCAPDLIDKGKTGFVFPVGDIDALANRLRQTATLVASGHDFGPALCAKMKDYSLEAGVSGTLQAITALRGLRE
jgi:glycosyltransferase involved in cell wall biosynthesis